ncbi:MAG: 16S rRNA (adenine(1518)-N(6)/adenine(1519)-N(6))-dimethyltransferase RsmA [Actinomycetota bacterium]
MTSGDLSLLGARRLRELLDEHGVRPHKELGQNFVIDPNTIRKVVEVARLEGTERVLEIGAGAGSLTLGLAAAAAHVTAVEFDRRLIGVLEETLGSLDNVEVAHADALDLGWEGIEADSVVANLPYNIATPLVVTMLERAPQIRTLTVMTQREVGERLAARPPGKAYGQVSVLVQYFGRASIAARISRNAFWPVPRVDSVLVGIERRAQPPPVDYDVLARLVKAGFSQRRKTLRNALADLDPRDRRVEELLDRSGIPPATRAETVTLEKWIELAREWR